MKEECSRSAGGVQECRIAVQAIHAVCGGRGYRRLPGGQWGTSYIQGPCQEQVAPGDLGPFLVF